MTISSTTEKKVQRVIDSTNINPSPTMAARNGGMFAPKPKEVSADPNSQLLNELAAPIGIVIKKSPLNGYGVFATRDFQEGDIVEEAPFVRTDYRSKDLVHVQIRQMCYPLPCICDECKHRGGYFVMTAGYVQMYNHSSEPNVKNDFFRPERIVRVIALRDLQKGEELFANYGSEYNLCEQPVEV